MTLLSRASRRKHRLSPRRFRDIRPHCIRHHHSAVSSSFRKKNTTVRNSLQPLTCTEVTPVRLFSQHAAVYFEYVQSVFPKRDQKRHEICCSIYGCNLITDYPTRYAMKRTRTLLLSIASLAMLFAMSGCYTQIALHEDYPRYDERNYADYSETYTDEDGTVVTNNYYYDSHPRARAYFNFYYPLRFGSVWSMYYDPWYVDSWYYWDPWWYRPAWTWHRPWYYYPTYWGGGYGWHHYGHVTHRPVYYTSRTDSRVRTSGATRTDSRLRSSDPGRSIDGTRTINTAATRSGATRTGSSYDNLQTRTNEVNATRSTTTRQQTGTTSDRSATQTRSTGTQTRSSGSSESVDRTSTPTRTTTGTSQRSGSSDRNVTAPRSGSSDRSSTAPTRSTSPPRSSGSSPTYRGGSSSSGSSSGGTRSSGSSSSGSSRSSSGGGSSRGR